MTSTDVMTAAETWLTQDPDPDTRQELTELLTAATLGRSDAFAGLEDRFSGSLQFGTAGLRGALGAGPNRMNRVVVIRAAAGLAAYLTGQGHHGRPVVVGYDARHKSEMFAADSAAVLAGAGFRPLLLPRPLPTPVLAYAIRALDCAAGVMVTASHNPAADNGYKVYLGDGSQIVPPADVDIAAAIAAVGSMDTVPRHPDGTELLDESIVERYLDRVVGLLPTDPPDGGALRLVYTPMHGVGSELVERTLYRAGYGVPATVPAQADPDPDFPTVEFPNPEEPGALDLAYALADEITADLIVANDPDADRCAVATPTPTGWRRLTGDEVGALLAVHLLHNGASGTLATSIVSSSLLASIAAQHELPYAETLTGFKWIGRIPDLAFGYEEALGYCVDPAAVADKDGISALLHVVELAAQCKASGRTLLDILDDIAREYGVHATEQISIRVDDIDRTDSIVRSLITSPPDHLAGHRVYQVDDLSCPDGTLPPTTGVRFHLADRGRVIVRPSGTEPKLKCYLEVVVPVTNDAVEAARASAHATLAALRSDLAPLLS